MKNNGKNIVLFNKPSWILMAVAVTITTIIGCTSRVMTPMNQSLLEKENLLHVRLRTGKEIKVKEPRFEEGFLVGVTPVYETRPGPHKKIKIAIGEIESIEVERIDRRKTIIWTARITILLGIFYTIVRFGSASGGLR